MPCLDSTPAGPSYTPPGYFEVHFDGSYTPDTDQNVAQAGYGVAVARPSSNQIDEYCAPVSTIAFHANSRGANRLSNNVAEVHGAILATIGTLPPGRVIIGYDSEYARRVTTGEWRPRHNARLVARSRMAFQRVSLTHELIWQHIGSHTGHHLNNLAGELAGTGANGITQLAS